jgi:hypothetical protein
LQDVSGMTSEHNAGEPAERVRDDVARVSIAARHEEDLQHFDSDAERHHGDERRPGTHTGDRQSDSERQEDQNIQDGVDAAEHSAEEAAMIDVRISPRGDQRHHRNCDGSQCGNPATYANLSVHLNWGSQNR